MGDKIIPLHKLEERLDELFALSDGELSEDGFESDERESEAVFMEPSQEELLDILNSPSTSSVARLGPELQPTSGHVTEQEGNSDDLDFVQNEMQQEAISDSDESDDDNNWKKVYFTHNVPTDKFDLIPLTSTHRFPPRSSPLAYLRRFFSEEVICHIVEQTNLYALQNKQKDWEDVSATEMCAFLGMLVLMGVHPLPNIDLYWSTDPLFCVPEIANVMTSKKFKKILRNLHLNDNNKMPKKGEPEFDKLYKLRPLIDYMNKSFQNEAKNTSSQSIDECIVKFKGRNSFKQYMPNKPIKRGFKIWARCDSQTGYLFECEIYTGKKGNEVETRLGESIVLSLCQKMIDEKMEYSHITYDNIFSSTELLQTLFEKNTLTDS